MSTRTLASSLVPITGLTLAAALGLSACGSDDPGTASDPAATSASPEETTPSPSEEPSETNQEPDSGSSSGEEIAATGSAGVSEAQLVSATDAGGTDSELACALDSEQAVADFTTELQNGFGDVVAQTVADVAGASSGATPYGAVVSIGCEPPRSVAIDAGEAGFQVLPQLPKSDIECLAPVTYVVVFAAPDA